MKHDARVNLKINEPEGGRLSNNGAAESFGGEGERASAAAPKSLDEAIEDLEI